MYIDSMYDMYSSVAAARGGRGDARVCSGPGGGTTSEDVYILCMICILGLLLGFTRTPSVAAGLRWLG